MKIPWHLKDLDKWVLVIGSEEICYLYGSKKELERLLAGGDAKNLGIPKEYIGRSFTLIAEI